MRRQEGSVGALIITIVVLVIISLLALATLKRTGTISSEREQTTKALGAAVTALDAFAATNSRLPCPADPSLDTGDEALAGDCTFPAGTLPWRTIGMRSDDALDAWGLKLSYRVYTGSGSLTQPNGVSMVACDTLEATPGGLTADGANNSGRLCNDDATVKNRNTTPALFLAGKGLQLTDLGTAHNDVAYVVISHGSTGLGAWTVSGAQRALPDPAGTEFAHTTAAGPFVIRAFSDLETASTLPEHYDDLLAYRTLTDLVKLGTLAARNWPDDVLSSIVFDQPTVEAALGHAQGAGDTGQQTIAFNNATVTAFDAGGNQNVAFDTAGTESIGGVGGGSNGLTNTGGEGLRIDFPENARQFAFTLDDFGYEAFIGVPIWIERMELRFYTVDGAGSATLVNTTTKQGCNPDGGLASFSVDPGVDFNRVELRPLSTTTFVAINLPTDTGLSEIRTCPTAVTCHTGLETAGNLCP
jgi:type II secretory pathway pseudopilin PulG